MGIEQILLVIAALVPAVFLCVYIYKKDRADKEPIGTLLLLLLCGVVICVPVVIVGSILGDIILGFFSNSIAIAENGELYYRDEFSLILYQFLHATVEVALVEEGFKWLVLMLFAKKCKHFNSLFDGIIYAVFVSLGFAAFENVLYVLQNGWQTAIVRAVVSVPGHMFFAVLMGLFFSDYFMTKLAHQTEIACKRQGILPHNQPEFSETKPLLLSLLVPTLAHGLFDFFLFIGSPVFLIAFVALVVGLYIFCFKRIKSTSKQDTHAQLCVLKMMDTKYPGYADMAARMGAIPQGEGEPTALMPIIPVNPTGVQTGAVPNAPAYRYAGIYTKTAGIVHLVAAPKQTLYAGATIATIQTPSGALFPIMAGVNCQVDKYDVVEGQVVEVNKLLGVIKYAI